MNKNIVRFSLSRTHIEPTLKKNLRVNKKSDVLLYENRVPRL